MSQYPALLAAGIFFILLGAGLIALTRRPLKAMPPRPTKSDLRERSALEAEMRKMKLGAAICGGLGILMIALS